MTALETGFEYLSPLPDYQDDLPFTGERVSDDGSLRIVRTLGETSCASEILTADFMAVRHEYVTARGWLPGSLNDEDRYDADAATQFILRSNPEDPIQVFGGMRLTAVEDGLDESMTWRMMDRNPAMRDSALSDPDIAYRLEEAAKDGAVHDLTRLVLASDGRFSGARATKDVILDIFGAGITATHEAGKDTAWVFLTTKEVHSYLGHLGIKFDTLAADKVTPTDEVDSYLCVTYPADTLEYTRTADKVSARYTYNRLMQAQDSL